MNLTSARYVYITDFPHKCVCSTVVYKLPADTLTMCCVIFAATALLCVSYQIVLTVVRVASL